MIYGSVCSGIEAATVAWHPLEWKPAWFSEIEKFPSAVLEHHYPHIENRGDMTKFKEWNNGAIDLLVGGTPCQSYSVAGLRKGLADPRGNLMLTFGSIAAKYRPTWLVWENVPGVLSSNGGRDFGTFLGMLEELNYIVDVDILDAQYFGLAQRRRRVFVCAQHLDDLLKQRTNSSALTITQCLMQILQGILVGAYPEYERLPENSASARLSRDGVLRRIKLFKMLGGEGHWQMLQSNLAGALAKCRAEAKNSEGSGGEKGKELTAEDLLMDLKADLPSLPTEESLNKSLADACEAMKLFTTSTSTNITTSLQISLFKAALNIASLTLHLSGLSPSSSDSELSNLTTLMEYMNYARQASRDLFADPRWIREGRDLIREAERHEEAFGHLGNWRSAAAVLFERHSLSGDIAPSRKAGQAVAALTANGVGTCGADDNQGQTGHLIPFDYQSSGEYGGGQVSVTLSARDYKSAKDLCVSITGEITHALNTANNGKGRSEDGAGRGVPTIAHSMVPYEQQGRRVQSERFVAPTLMSNPAGGVKLEPVLDERLLIVRRLTPVECERLQGFEDDYTLIPWRGKNANQCPDGPRYKSLGNSMAVPVMRWIGERIKQVEAMRTAA